MGSSGWARARGGPSIGPSTRLRDCPSALQRARPGRDDAQHTAQLHQPVQWEGALAVWV